MVESKVRWVERSSSWVGYAFVDGGAQCCDNGGANTVRAEWATENVVLLYL